MLSLPYNKKRYYLSGMDWIIGALNEYMLSTGGAGNHSSLLVELPDEISETRFRERVEGILQSLPLLAGRRKRDFANLAPFWSVGDVSGGFVFALETINIASDDELSNIFTTALNREFQNDSEHLSFLLFRQENSNMLLMTFDHSVLDARGAELFLNLLAGEHDDHSRELLEVVKKVDAPELRHWYAKFAAGRYVQRKIIEMTKTTGCFAFLEGRVGRQIKPPRLSASFHTFSVEETSTIKEESEQVAGYMMETVYLLAVSALSLYRLAASECEEWFFVPVPIDVRGNGNDGMKKLLFNHFSFLFFYFKVTPDSSVESLASEIRGQLHLQIAEEFPEKMIAAAYLGRIFPLWLIRRFMRLPFEGKMATFVFANVGAGSPPDDILGVEVASIRHMPRIPSPPGIGVFFNTHAGRLNLTVTTDSANLGDDIANGAFSKIIEGLKTI